MTDFEGAATPRAGNMSATEGNLQENASVEQLLSHLKGSQGTLMVFRRKEVGRDAYLGAMTFDPQQNTIAHFFGFIRAKWGPGAYRIKRQGESGSGFGKGSAILDIDPDEHASVPAAPAYSAQTVATMGLPPPAQVSGDVNTQLVKILGEFLQNARNQGLGPEQVKDILVATQAGWNSNLQSLASRFDSNGNSLSQLRELIKLSRELNAEQDHGPPERSGSDMSDMMQFMTMMQGFGGRPQQQQFAGPPGWSPPPYYGAPTWGPQQPPWGQPAPRRDEPPGWAKELMARMATMERVAAQFGVNLAPQSEKPAQKPPERQESPPSPPVASSEKSSDGPPRFQLDGWNQPPGDFGNPFELPANLMDQMIGELDEHERAAFMAMKNLKPIGR